ncbi:oxidoreductase, SDR family [Mycobacterium sp. JS623]|uniref:mycofactocin-coupled SDR family oxidoreductase n=1 Tax=Mycobacterium sp. JS623 TaxID=212767 RepID=UPI0002A57665|nr:mycofactocin-coupled SDR family oxidoreductase [Mycobacterium sp. JS623]AGB24406.1 oxidoreductase, SDR family [Mycobacterium sp. JS623]
MTGRLMGKIALVTGAARGIRRAQALRFAQEGADVIALDICEPVDTVAVPASTAEDLDETARLVRDAGGRIVTNISDVRDEDQLRWAAEAGVEAFGGLDIVCATAGITSRGLATELSEAAWQTMLDVNLTGVWRTCKVTAPHLITRGSGAIILVSSIAGLRGLLGVAHYTAAKHGVVGLMRSIANELAPHGIRVNSVHPTNVDTPLIQNAAVASAFRPDLDRVPTREEFAEAARTMNMLDIPWVEPIDVANACLFLASDEARYITAATLPVDAGATQRQENRWRI